jgi:hypothetical protein
MLDQTTTTTTTTNSDKTATRARRETGARFPILSATTTRTDAQLWQMLRNHPNRCATSPTDTQPPEPTYNVMQRCATLRTFTRPCKPLRNIRVPDSLEHYEDNCRYHDHR